MRKDLVLITRPHHDEPTYYLHYIAGELKKLIEDIGEYTVIDLDTEKATRNNVEKVLDRSSPRLVVLNGHGNYKAILGQNEIILDETNVMKLNSKIVYAVACDSSEYLGEIAIEQGGAESYIGYESSFMIVTDSSRSSNPSKDKTLKVFKDVYATTIISILTGYSIEKSVERTKEHTKKLIREYGVLGIRDKFGSAPTIRFALYWNWYCLKAHGKIEATI